MNTSYDRERDGVLLGAGEVCALLNVSRSHLPNLRANGTLRGYKQHAKGHWKYPSDQRALNEARAALHGEGPAFARAEADRRRHVRFRAAQ